MIIDQKKIDRFIECISRISGWNTLMNDKEFEQLAIQAPSLRCWCKGESRKIVRKKIDKDLYKVYTEKDEE